MKAVIFDIDGTLTKVNSWSYLTEQLGASWSEHLRTFRALQEGVLNESEAQRQLLDLWNSTGNATREVFQKIFESIPLCEDAREAIDYLSTRGYTLCLITGSMDLYAKVIGERLGIAHFFANARLTWDAQGNLTSFTYTLNQASKKLEHFQMFCKQNDLQSSDCCIVGDSGNDRELFRTTRRGIAVRTEFEDKELELIAWKVISSLGELKNFL